MRFIVTLMVRDEIDIISAMIEHTVTQKPDMIIVTDNGSVDGTTEVLRRYADRGVLELHHDPVHRKQQHSVVTSMARRARTHFAADWVINADADEFWTPQNTSLTLRDALEQTPLALNAFTVPVVNMVGYPARRGSGFSRLVWRDLRTNEQLQQIGIHAQPTPNAVHRGEPDVVVAQGNHFVSIESSGQPDQAVALEVRHLPWRSWDQFEKKVLHAGRAYEQSPDLRPSKNHHGMNDYRRHIAGRLLPAYLLRQPSTLDLKQGEHAGYFSRDDWLRKHLLKLSHHAVCPDLLIPLLDDTKDEPFQESEVSAQSQVGRQFLELERERDTASAQADEYRSLANRLARERDQARRKLQHQSVGAEAVALVRRAQRGLLRRLSI